jgi:hypothetical protein
LGRPRRPPAPPSMSPHRAQIRPAGVGHEVRRGREASVRVDLGGFGDEGECRTRGGGVNRRCGRVPGDGRTERHEQDHVRDDVSHSNGRRGRHERQPADPAPMRVVLKVPPGKDGRGNDRHRGDGAPRRDWCRSAVCRRSRTTHVVPFVYCALTPSGRVCRSAGRATAGFRSRSSAGARPAAVLRTSDR